MCKCLLISANVTVPIGPVQLASNMEELRLPPESSEVYTQHIVAPAYSKYENGEVHSKELFKKK